MKIQIKPLTRTLNTHHNFVERERKHGSKFFLQSQIEIHEQLGLSFVTFTVLKDNLN